MIKEFEIKKNNFLLQKDIIGYYHQYYVGYNRPGNPDFLNVLKNTFNSEPLYKLEKAMNEVVRIVREDIPLIIGKTGIRDWMVVCVPRAKALSYYKNSQLMFIEGVRKAVKSIPGVIDGTDCIRRVVNTKTTHIRDPRIPNDGPEPYRGITVDTCEIDKSRIENKNIILVDDIYTKNVNVDEDCLQALLDNKAKNLIFYSVAYTRRNYEVF